MVVLDYIRLACGSPPCYRDRGRGIHHVTITLPREDVVTARSHFRSTRNVKMWLIDTDTRNLHEFEASIPRYAILSHRWGIEELNFKEVYKKRVDTTKRGHAKLVGACRIAARHGLRYLWIDTCCIDKKSSAELSEAINSTFAWYQNAQICLAYLEDVKSDRAGRSFEKSVWFTRAWTLQELLAPKKVFFYNRFWTKIADKSSDDLTIAEITGIPCAALSGYFALSQWNLAERMSWASERQATRVEDIAYSLMGIFDLHMPMLYGEGKRSFIRLQEEIIRKSRAPEFLLWRLEQNKSNLLADSPADFGPRGSGHLWTPMGARLFTLTNLGLELEAELFKCGLGLYAMPLSWLDGLYLILNELVENSGKFDRVCIISQNLDATEHRWCVQFAKRQKILILKEGMGWTTHSPPNRTLLFQPYSVKIRCSRPLSLQPIYSLSDPENEDDLHDPSIQSASFPGKSSLSVTWLSHMSPGVAKMVCRVGNGCSLLLEFTFDFHYHPCLLVRHWTETKILLPSLENLNIQQLCQMHAPTRYYVASTKWVEVTPKEITEADHPCYLVRGEAIQSCAKLPHEVTDGSKIWVFFVPANENNPWRVAVSDKPDPHMTDWHKLFG